MALAAVKRVDRMPVKMRVMMHRMRERARRGGAK
jgi:hypothetical protein